MSDNLTHWLRDEASFAYDRAEKDMLTEAANRIEALEAENERLREELAAAYIKLSGTDQHASDCATSNAPAMEPGPCNCKETAETFTRSGNV